MVFQQSNLFVELHPVIGLALSLLKFGGLYLAAHLLDTGTQFIRAYLPYLSAAR